MHTAKSTFLEVFREGLFEYRFYLALINATTRVTVYVSDV